MEKKEVWLKSLLTKTPQEGRELAIKMARKVLQPYKQIQK